MNGSFFIARKSFESELWRKKPPAWWKIWCFILGNVHFEPFKEIKRGQGYFNFTEFVKMGVLGDITINQVEKFIKYAKRAEMVAVTKATHGILITVLKYNLYQNTSSYKSGDKSGGLSGTEAERKRNGSGDILDNKGNKDKKDNILSSEKISDDSTPAPEVIKLHERLPIEKQQLLHRLVYHLEDTLKTKIVNWGKQAKAVKMMIQAGYEECQIKNVINYMATSDEFFEDKGFDMMTVANNIARYKAEAVKRGGVKNGQEDKGVEE